MSKWIAAEDKLPKDKQRVITYWPRYEKPSMQQFHFDIHTFYKKYHAAGGPWWINGSANVLLADELITHWMPLPGSPGISKSVARRLYAQQRENLDDLDL